MPKRLVWDSARDGHWVDDNDEIKPGQSVRVRMQDMPFLRDSKRTTLTDTFKIDDASLDQFRPGYRLLGDKARETVRNARQEMIDRATNAWRMDARKRKPEPDEPDEDDDETTMISKMPPRKMPEALIGLKKKVRMKGAIVRRIRMHGSTQPEQPLPTSAAPRSTPGRK
jgi:hypothetical protein